MSDTAEYAAALKSIESINAVMLINKNAGKHTVTVTGGTKIPLFDLFFVMQSLYIVAHRALPSMKSEADMKQTIIECIEILFEEKGKNNG